MATATLKIKGMTCGGCVASVERVLKALDGVEAAEVSLDEAQAKVSYSGDRVDLPRLRSAVEDAGFDVVG